MTEQVMSEAELAEFEQNHSNESGYCRECAVPYMGEFAEWPCDAAKLVAEVRKWQALVRALTRGDDG
jgi:hypothetical protein